MINKATGSDLSRCTNALWENGIDPAACITLYRQHLRAAEHSEATVQKYGRDLARFLQFAQGTAPDGIADSRAKQGAAAAVLAQGATATAPAQSAAPDRAVGINKASLMAWKQSLLDAGYAPPTVNTMLAAVNGFLEFAGHADQRVKPVRCQRALFRARSKELTKPEYLRLLTAARRQGRRRLFLVMETMCATGIRISELQSITVQAAREGRAAIHCKGKCRVILIPRRLCRQLLAWAKENKITAGPVFQTRGGKPVDRSNIWREMRRLCKEANVDSGKVFPHNLRHLFAVVFYRAEKDLAKLADVLGHSSINTTRLYIMETGVEHERMLSMLGLIL